MRRYWIAGLFVSMALCAATPAFAEEMKFDAAPDPGAPRTKTTEPVALSPAPGVTLTLPKGWIACDDTTDAMLGHVADPMNVRAKMCGRSIPGNVPGLNMVLRAFDPAPFHTSAVTLLFDRSYPLSEESIKAIFDNITPETTQAVCNGVTAPISGEAEIISCDITQTTLGGHPAVLTTVIGVPAGLQAAKFRLRVYEIASPQGYVEFQFNNPVLFQSITDPTADAILKSITVQ